MSRQDEVAKALSELLEEHGSKAVLGALADACKAGEESATNATGKRWWQRSAARIRSSASFVGAAEKHSDLTLADYADCLVED